MTVQVASKPVRRLLIRVALTGVPRDGAGRLVTVALVSRIAWALAYLVGAVDLALSMEFGRSPVTQALMLIAALAGLAGITADRLKAAMSR